MKFHFSAHCVDNKAVDYVLEQSLDEYCVCVCVLSLLFISYITRVGNEMRLSDVTHCARGVFNITPRYVMLQNVCMCCVCITVKQLGTTNMLCMQWKPKTEHTHHRQLRLFKLKLTRFSVSILWLRIKRRFRF